MKKYFGEEAYDAQSAIYALTSLFNLLRKEVDESEQAPEQIAALQDSIKRLKDFIIMELQEETTAKKFDTWLDSKTAMVKSDSKVSVIDDPELQAIFKKFTEMGFETHSEKLEKAVAERDALMKSSDQVLARVEELVQKMNKQTEDIARLSATAVPPPTLRIVSKSVDSEITNTHTDPNMKKFIELSPEERALAVIKASQVVQRS
jgi:uncharacterized small protein (DUF1192 family)